MSEIKKVVASVRQRLLNISRKRSEDFNLILIRYAAERLLYRLSVSEHANRFVLKGAMLFTVWFDTPHRSTRDLDFLVHGDPDPDKFRQVFESICQQSVQDDGIRYDTKTIQIDPIREPEEYGGLRVRMKSFLSTIPVPVQADIGFGDIVTPGERIIEFPTLLDLPAPKLKSYPPETMIAEKFHTLVSLGIANSRMKDFYDLYVIKRNYPFNNEQLISAIKATFQRRKTKIPKELPIAFSDKFATDHAKSTQWQSFIKRNDIKDVPKELVAVIDDLREFFSKYIFCNYSA